MRERIYGNSGIYFISYILLLNLYVISLIFANLGDFILDTIKYILNYQSSFYQFFQMHSYFIWDSAGNKCEIAISN